MSTPQQEARAREIIQGIPFEKRHGTTVTECLVCGPLLIAISTALARERAEGAREEREAWTKFLNARASEEADEASDRSSGEDYRRMHRYVATHLKSWVAALRARDAI